MFVIRWGQMQFPNDLLERRRASVPGAVHIRLAPIRVPAFFVHSIPRGLCMRPIAPPSSLAILRGSGTGSIVVPPGHSTLGDCQRLAIRPYESRRTFLAPQIGLGSDSELAYLGYTTAYLRSDPFHRGRHSPNALFRSMMSLSACILT